MAAPLFAMNDDLSNVEVKEEDYSELLRTYTHLLDSPPLLHF